MQAITNNPVTNVFILLLETLLNNVVIVDRWSLSDVCENSKTRKFEMSNRECSQLTAIDSICVSRHNYYNVLKSVSYCNCCNRPLLEMQVF